MVLLWKQQQNKNLNFRTGSNPVLFKSNVMWKTVKLLIGTLLLVSCTENEDPIISETESFNRGAMLVNWADNIIIPSFENFASVTQRLEEKTLEFTATPTEANLEVLRNTYREAYLQFQTVSLFEIGKAEMINYRSRLNTYPTDREEILEKIEDKDFNLELPSSYDEQGFPALDFLINGLAETDAETVAFYSTNSNAEAYKGYLGDISKTINSTTDEVLLHWKNSFRETFVANTTSSSTGAVDRFTNDYIMYYERFLRSGKIGIPAGIFTGNPAPGTVEAFYADGLSKDLYLKALETVQNFFNGAHFGSAESGPSYKQYLDYMNSVKKGENLSALINTQFDATRKQAEKLDPNFVEQVKMNNDLMLGAFDELQKNVVLLKVDMLQSLSISVDYVDSDGD